MVGAVHNQRRAVLMEVVRLTEEWIRKEPEDIRDILQLWQDELDDISLTRREIFVLRATIRKLKNHCSDRSGKIADYLPVGAVGGLLVAAAGFVAAQVARYPPWLALLFVILGLAAFVVGVILGAQQRRWKIPADDFVALEKKFTEKMGASKNLPDEDTEEAIMDTLRAFVGGASLRTTIQSPISHARSTAEDAAAKPPASSNLRIAVDDQDEAEESGSEEDDTPGRKGGKQ